MRAREGGRPVDHQPRAGERQQPQAAEAVGQALARDVARMVDAAFFSTVSSPAPGGLTSLSGISTVVNSGAFGNLDFAAQCISKARVVGANITAFVTTPAVLLALSIVKTLSGATVPLLGVDNSQQSGSLSIFGVPVYTSPSVATNTLWAYDATRVYAVVREDATVDSDASVLFTSDRIAVRAIMRVGFACTHNASVVKLTLA